MYSVHILLCYNVMYAALCILYLVVYSLMCRTECILYSCSSHIVNTAAVTQSYQCWQPHIVVKYWLHGYRQNVQLLWLVALVLALHTATNFYTY
jgi:hypothetical protein